MDGKIPQVPRPFAFKVNFISFKLLLIFDSSWQRDYFEVHLAYLDLDQGKCTFLDTETVRGPLWSVLFDINDRRKFGMWSIDNRLVGFLVVFSIQKRLLELVFKTIEF